MQDSATGPCSLTVCVRARGHFLTCTRPRPTRPPIATGEREIEGEGRGEGEGFAVQRCYRRAACGTLLGSACRASWGAHATGSV